MADKILGEQPRVAVRGDIVIPVIDPTLAQNFRNRTITIADLPAGGGGSGTPGPGSVGNTQLADMPALTVKANLDGVTGAVSDVPVALLPLSTAAANADAALQTSITDGLATKLNTAGGAISGPITYSGTPSSDTELVNKGWVVGVTAGIIKRTRARAGTTGNITIATALNSGDTIDGVVLADGDVVLVKNQTAAAQNGVYVAGASPARFSEYDTFDEHLGSQIVVYEGTQAGTVWLCTASTGGTLGVTDITYDPSGVTGALIATNNLGDVSSPATARTNIGALAASGGTASSLTISSATIAGPILNNTVDMDAGAGTNTIVPTLGDSFKRTISAGLTLTIAPDLPIGRNIDIELVHSGASQWTVGLSATQTIFSDVLQAPITSFVLGVGKIRRIGLSRTSNRLTIYGEQEASVGDVTGPSSSTAGRIPKFGGTTGKVLVEGTPGTDYSVPAGTETLTNKTLGLYTQSEALTLSLTTSGGTVLDVTKNSSRSVSADTTYTFSGTPPTGRRFELQLTNTDSNAHTITIPSSVSFTTGSTITSFSIPANTTRELGWSQAGSVLILYGEQNSSPTNETFDAFDTIASAATTDLGSIDSLNVAITGTTGITSFGTAAAGTTKFVRHTQPLQITYNATTMVIAGGFNLAVVAGDAYIARSLGSGNWIIDNISRADGEPPNGFISSTQTIASASTTDLATKKGKWIGVTGSTTITSFGTGSDGLTKFLAFTGSLTITYNATSMITPGLADISTAAGDCAIARCDGSGNWVITEYTRRSGQPLIDAGATVASAATTAIAGVSQRNITVSGTTTITSFGSISAGTWRKVTFSGALTLTHNATSLILPGGANITTVAGDSLIATSLSSGNWRVDSYTRATVGPDGYAYMGVLSGIPAASAVQPFARAMIDEAAVSGVKMQPPTFKSTYEKTGASRVWKPDGRQVLLAAGGNNANPLFTITAAGTTPTATGTATLGTLPANLMTIEGTCVTVDVFVGRGAVAAGTATVSVSIGGVIVARIQSWSASTTRSGWISGRVWVRTSTTQTGTLDSAPGGLSNNSASSSIAITGTSAAAVTVDVSAATVDDTFLVEAYTVAIE